MAKFHKAPPPPNSSYSTEWLLKQQQAPQVSALMVQGVSQYRKEQLAQEVEQGIYREGSGSSGSGYFGYNQTAASVVAGSTSGIKKNAQVLSSSFGPGMPGIGGGGNTAKQIPEIYSPLWLASNLNLPRDRATINAWCRAFFALNPFVHNAINLHSTYPISKLNIKCANKNVERFFNDLIEEIGLMNICVQIAMEYWLLGESFVYAELDPHKGKWNRLVIQNPDYMVVKRTVLADEPVIMLRPDQNLHNVVNSNKPSDIAQRKQLSQYIVDAVRRGENIPMNNLNVSHLARKISPYEIRGTGLPVCVFRQLMLFDKNREAQFAQADQMINPLTLVKIGSEGLDGLHPTHGDLEAWRETFECHDEETEVLTESGFKKFNEVIEYQEVMDGTYNQSHITNVVPKQGVRIACFNPNNEQLEYHEPLGASLYNYDGDMYHFHNYKMDIKVSPNHKMWVQERTYKYDGKGGRKSTWSEWKKVEAQDLNYGDYNRFRTKIKWEGENPKSVKVCDKEIPTELYLEFMGYLLSEGCLYQHPEGKSYTVDICQSTDKFKEDMHSCIDRLCKCLGKSYSSRINKRSEDSDYCDMWSGTISGKNIYQHFKDEVANEMGGTYSFEKQMPQWIKGLSVPLLSILLEAMVKGDGSVKKRKDPTKHGYSYCTTSKQLADDVYEVAYKCGYAPLVFTVPPEETGGIHMAYVIMWSDCGKGEFPLVWKTSRNSQTKEKRSNIDVEHYEGKIWCFQVPTGLFITRRNGKITIQGNSLKFDKDATIFSHPGISVERVGYNQGIIDVNPTLQQLIKEIYVGLMVPSVVIEGGDTTTYANAGVALDVLRQRYMQFRNMMSLWLKRKIFAPISEIQGFWEYSKGGSGRSSEKQLIIPEVDWNHMSLFDAGDYTSNLIALTQAGGADSPPRASIHTLYRSLGLEWEDEQRKLRQEAIQSVILQKERQALETLSLNELRAIGTDDEIPEPQNGQEAPLPGEMGAGSDMSSPPPSLGLPGLGGPSTPPPPPPATPPSTPPTPPLPPTP